MCKFLDTDDTEYLEAALEAKSEEFSLFGACLGLSHEWTQHTLRARKLVIRDDTEGQRALQRDVDDVDELDVTGRMRVIRRA